MARTGGFSSYLPASAGWVLARAKFGLLINEMVKSGELCAIVIGRTTPCWLGRFTHRETGHERWQ